MVGFYFKFISMNSISVGFPFISKYIKALLDRDNLTGLMYCKNQYRYPLALLL